MKEKILITVKTYPALSKKYAELVCTAGVNEEGEWRRIFPVRFRQLNVGQKYKKYQWVESEIKKSETDHRPETYQIVNAEKLNTLGEPLPTGNDWQARRMHFIDKIKIYENLTALIESAHENKLSLAAFRPHKWLRFVTEDAEREWDPEGIALLEYQKKQGNFFKDKDTVADEFKVVKKLPYKFSYKFEDEDGKESKLMIEDWEIGALYWNCMRDYGNDEKIAKKKVAQKYWNDFTKNPQLDTLLVLGTTLEHHNKQAPNPFVIISVIPLPRETHRRLL